MFALTYGLLWMLAAGLLLLVGVAISQISHLKAASAVVNKLSLRPLGSVAPEFAAIDLRTGETIESRSLLGKQLALCIVSSGCTSCSKLMEELAESDGFDASRLVIYCHGEQERCATLLNSLTPSVRLISAGAFDLPALFHLGGLPTVVMLDPGGRIVGYRYPTCAADVVETLVPPQGASRLVRRHVA